MEPCTIWDALEPSEAIRDHQMAMVESTTRMSLNYEFGPCNDDGQTDDIFTIREIINLYNQIVKQHVMVKLIS